MPRARRALVLCPSSGPSGAAQTRGAGCGPHRPGRTRTSFPGARWAQGFLLLCFPRVLIRLSLWLVLQNLKPALADGRRAAGRRHGPAFFFSLLIACHGCFNKMQYHLLFRGNNSQPALAKCSADPVMMHTIVSNTTIVSRTFSF